MAKLTFAVDGDLTLLTFDLVNRIHDIALIEGGMRGILNRAAIESALYRPQNLIDYEGCDDLLRLAASLWYALSSAHGFCDGNKRTAILSTFTFLEMNGVEIADWVPGDEPGLFIDELYRSDSFEEAKLENYLATRCVWITG